MEGNLLSVAGAYEVLAGYYDQLMDEIDYDYWCDYILSLVKPAAATGESELALAGKAVPLSFGIDALRGWRVLDLACGTGQFAYRLQQRGLEVTAVDISSEMLAVAEAKARSLGSVITFARQDMRQLELPGSYDLVLCLCDSLNYLLEPEELAATFSGVSRVLKPGGHFAFDINTEYKLATVYGDQTYAADLDEFSYIWQNEYHPDTKLCYMDLAFFVPVKASGKSGRESVPQLFKKLTESHVQRAFSPEFMEELIQNAGLELLGQYGDLTLASPNSTTERITFHCRKHVCP
ncbi:MAG: class I SAM-dependent methyltransferase [Firmicutes bacterium]|nr:class I SAM-dependent methyltransferase [Bacillota bacterium]